MNHQETFAQNAESHSNEVVNEAIKLGKERAKFWNYPDTFWTTSIRTGGYEFEIHKPNGEEPGILRFYQK